MYMPIGLLHGFGASFTTATSIANKGKLDFSPDSALDSRLGNPTRGPIANAIVGHKPRRRKSRSSIRNNPSVSCLESPAKVASSSGLWSASETRAVTFGHAPREPVGGEAARDLRALQHDLRQHRARRGLGADAVGQLERARVKARFFEFGLPAQLEVVPDFGLAHADSLRHHAHGELGRARLLRDLAALEAHQVAVEVEGDARHVGHRLLERGIAALVVPGV